MSSSLDGFSMQARGLPLASWTGVRRPCGVSLLHSSRQSTGSYGRLRQGRLGPRVPLPALRPQDLPLAVDGRPVAAGRLLRPYGLVRNHHLPPPEDRPRRTVGAEAAAVHPAERAGDVVHDGRTAQVDDQWSLTTCFPLAPLTPSRSGRWPRASPRPDGSRGRPRACPRGRWDRWPCRPRPPDGSGRWPPPDD